MNIRFRLLLALSCLVLEDSFLPKAVRAETHMVAALTPEAVWKAIDAARDGDTVQLPAGTANWLKGWNTGRGAKMKAITIQGAGMDRTIICDHRDRRGGSVPFQLQGVEGKPFRITSITFDGTGWPDAGLWGGFISISGTCKNFRIDHCKFKSACIMMSINASGSHDETYGLIDHCDFDDKDFAGGLAQPIWFSGPGATNYRKPLSLGTAKALYLEDNEVYLSPVAAKGGDCPWIAPNNGARVVIRHNQIINSQIEIYGAGVRKGCYGCQQAEIYDNTFSAIGLKQGEPQGFIFINAGVGIVFNNTVTGTTYNTRTIQLTHGRSFCDRGGFGVCDGTNPVDGNQIPAGQKGAGYPAMGQPGRGTDADGDGVFEPSPWNSFKQLDSLHLPDQDRNLIVTFHYYDPFEFTHQGTPWTGQKDKTGVAWRGTEKERQAIEQDFDRVQAWAKRENRPIYLGEFGTYEKGEMDSRVRWTAFVARQAERRGWSWAYWQFAGDFVLFDMASQQWVQPIRKALIPMQ